MKTFTIELRVDDNMEEHRITALTGAARQAAAQLYTSALLVSDERRKPQIALFTGDLFETNKEIEVLAEDQQ